MCHHCLAITDTAINAAVRQARDTKHEVTLKDPGQTGLEYARARREAARAAERGARDLALLSPPATVQRRQRVLDAKELGRLLRVLRSSSSAYAAALQFFMLTLARRSEVANARWRDIDFYAKQSRLPETKNGQEHVIP